MKFAGSEKCQECRGKGYVILGERHGFNADDKCPVCHGRGIMPILISNEEKAMRDAFKKG